MLALKDVALSLGRARRSLFKLSNSGPIFITSIEIDHTGPFLLTNPTQKCPVKCKFNLLFHVQGVSIDFFNAQLPLHLESLCDHVISDHTGEDKMMVSLFYQYCNDANLNVRCATFVNCL